MGQKISHEILLAKGSYDEYTLEGVEPGTALGLYRSMLRFRRCEEALIKEYRVAEEMRCPVHFVIGQEAVPAALSLALAPEDHLFAHHRSHGYYLAKGAPMRQFVAELFGRATGANGGLAGSQEISHPATHFHSGAILTGASSIAAGVAFAFQLDKKPYVAAAGFGEAATEEGIFWEAINYAAHRKLPLVYVCENNLYSMTSPQLDRAPDDNIHERVASFGMRSKALFGNDAPLAYRAVRDAVERARAGQGPTFLEFYTYRWTAHVGPESDDFLGYRVPGARDFWKRHCPLDSLERLLREAGLLDGEKKAAMEREIDAEIADALAFARSSPFPAPDSYLAKNLSSGSPEADRLLKEGRFESFDGYQPDAIVAPY